MLTNVEPTICNSKPKMLNHHLINRKLIHRFNHISHQQMRIIRLIFVFMIHFLIFINDTRSLLGNFIRQIFHFSIRRSVRRTTMNSMTNISIQYHHHYILVNDVFDRIIRHIGHSKTILSLCSTWSRVRYSIKFSTMISFIVITRQLVYVVRHRQIERRFPSIMSHRTHDGLRHRLVFIRKTATKRISMNISSINNRNLHRARVFVDVQPTFIHQLTKKVNYKHVNTVFIRWHRSKIFVNMNRHVVIGPNKTKSIRQNARIAMKIFVSVIILNMKNSANNSAQWKIKTNLRIKLIRKYHLVIE